MKQEKRVLWIDDDARFLEYTTPLFEMHGFKVAGITDPNTVQNTLDSFHPEIVLLDLNLGNTDALDVFNLIRRSDNLVPIVIISGHIDDPQWMNSNVVKMADDVVAKPLPIVASSNFERIIALFDRQIMEYRSGIETQYDVHQKDSMDLNSNSLLRSANTIVLPLSAILDIRETVVPISPDKFKLSLGRNLTDLSQRSNWSTPFGILIAIILALVTAKFQNILGISGTTWHAVFLIGGVVTTIWLIKDLFWTFRQRKDTTEKTANRILDDCIVSSNNREI